MHWFLYLLYTYGRPFLFLVMLAFLQDSGLIDFFLAANPYLDFTNLKVLFFSYICIHGGAQLANPIVSQIWNKYTPIQDRATYIEGELIYVLSAALSPPLMGFCFFQLSVVSALQLSAILLLISPLVVGFGWRVGKWLAAMAAEQAKLVQPVEPRRTDRASQSQSQPQPQPSFKHAIKAHAFAALTFLFIISAAVYLFAAVKTGVMPDAKLLFAFFSPPTVAIFIMGGAIFVSVGRALQKIIKLNVASQRLKNVLDYNIGFMAILVVFSVPTFLLNVQTSPSTAWSLWAAFGMMIVAIMLSGIIYSYFYTAKAKPA